MNNYRIVLIIFVALLIAGIIVAIVLSTSENIGDFKVTYSGNAKKYQSSINKGINRWVSLGTGGVSMKVTTYKENDNTVAFVPYGGKTIHLNETVFAPLTNNLKIIAVAHEVGHVLGIGVWGDKYITEGSVTYLSNASFPKTSKAYVDHIRPSGITYGGPPLAGPGNFGQGSALVHWSPNSAYGLQRDLMTPSLSPSADLISVVDLQFIQEAFNIKVDLSKAQPLNFNYYSVVMEYVYGKEETNFCCGSCSNKRDKEE